MSGPLSVAVGVVIQDGNVLLINRERGEYTDKWALPGGKIETGEHVDEAVVREVREEAGIGTRFETYEGIVSEQLLDGDTITNQFVLHICRLSPLEKGLSSGDEGETRWVSMEDIGSYEGSIVASDYRILQECIEDRFSGCYQCRIDETGDRHSLERFEPV